MPERQKAKRTKSSKKMVVGGTAIAGRMEAMLGGEMETRKMPDDCVT